MLRRPPYLASLGDREEIGKHFIGVLEMDVIRNIGYNEIVEVTKPFLITFQNRKVILCGDFRALNDCTKAGSYPIPRISHSLERLEKAKYITKMELH
ncbi:hypothetical protein O181_017819 [Austropuccinia psidii MF-1]|uniref:Uncharacterized protein n=1 Tax=Austropuccinia psidii MF-1 TaxID=1389203 RepID=A0A9Q3GT56_9BASI|nr:hypothetical protein [Austropuccinia psidii MF-1]